MPDFEFDEAKSRMNAEKQGIDFEEAQALWLDPGLAEIPARSEDEARFLIIARHAGQHWAAVITCRDEAVRIISVRRARPEEIAIYEGR
ncbi:MAG: BrnT family toxin [Gemmatimonadetes bacterium]|nr:BrnT family toxin [Gemmatimonadota bacterium]